MHDARRFDVEAQSRATVLIVDDEPRSLEALRRVLSEDFEVIEARDAAEAEGVLAGELVEIVLCDQRMPRETGVDFLQRVRERWPDTIRIIISGYTASEDVIAGVNLAGIYRYVTKPWNPDELIEIVREAASLSRLHREASALPTELKPTGERLHKVVSAKRSAEKRLHEFDRIVHLPDSPMREAIALGRQAAKYDISVLVTGASGSGKELLARAIHYSSPRADKPFVVENCGALPDELLESELFGCKKGAFTGAYQDRIGLFELADGGAIFLDEIGETSPAFQVKLLRVLQEGEIRPLGAQRARKVDVRVLAATNRDLLQEVEAGRFRRDLYYRIAAFPVHMPSLAERSGDIPAIAARILLQVNQAFGRRVPGFAPGTLAAMQAYAWPGNVREMQNEIQRMVVLAENDAPLPAHLLSFQGAAPAPRAPVTADARPLRDQVAEIERAAIEAALKRHRDNISRAADALGLSRVGLRAKMERYDLRRDLADDNS
jgi:two-component system response regulator HupR/HoxA